MSRTINFLALTLSFFLAAPAFAINTVTIYADKSMSAAIIGITRSYSSSRNIVVNTSFAPQETQERQILDGAAVDILITHRGDWIDSLKTQGLIDIYSQFELARARLALVGPENALLKTGLRNGFPTAHIIREIGWEQGFVIGNPRYLLDGMLAREALRNLEVADYLEPYTLYIRHPGQMSDLARWRGAYGVFLQSTARSMAGVRVLDVFPEEMQPPVVYYAVVIAGNNMEEARIFMEYLKSRDVRRALVSYGYTIN